MPKGINLFPEDWPSVLHMEKLSSVIHPTQIQWLQDELEIVFNSGDVHKIMDIPLDKENEYDQLVWPFSPHGQYTVRSAYEWFATTRASCSSGTSKSFPFKLLQKCRWISPKLKLFVWRLICGALPTKSALRKRNILKQGMDLCALCKIHIESEKHLFVECQISQEIWKEQGINWKHKDIQQQISLLLHQGDARKLTLVISTLWAIWLGRCNDVFRGEMQDEVKIRVRALQIQNEQPRIEAHSAALQTSVGRSFPCSMFITIDAAVRDEICAWAVIAYTSEETLIGAWADIFPPHPPLQSEGYAILKALDIAREKGWENFTIATDCKKALEIIFSTQEILDIRTGMNIFREIKNQFTTLKANFTHIDRNLNQASHNLAYHAVKTTCSIAHEGPYVPSFISSN